MTEVPGTLTLIGLGPARAAQTTSEAVARLQEAEADGSRVYGFGHARRIVAEIAPNLKIIPLEPFYRDAAVERRVVYKEIARTLLTEAFDDGLDVVYLATGSPLFLDDMVLLIRRYCKAERLPLRLIHGLSFVDMVLDRVFWTGRGGLQIQAARNVARGLVDLAPDVPALLVQLGEFTSTVEAYDTSRSIEVLGTLRARLREKYPGTHPVTILYSSGTPHYRSLARHVELDDLGAAPVTIYSNLWVPAMGGPAAQTEITPDLWGEQTAQRLERAATHAPKGDHKA